jgi:hypothetical protein
VSICDDCAVWPDYESRAEPRGGSLAGAAAKKLLEHVSRYLLDDLRLDGDNRRRNTRYRVGDRCSARGIYGGGLWRR